MTVALVAVAVLVGAGAVAHLAAGGGRPRGLAPGFDVVRTMSAAAVRRRGVHTRPSSMVRPWTPARDVGIELARAGRRWLFATVEDVVLVFAPPRTGKTALLACTAQDAPGAVMVTSTRTDIVEHSIAERAARGPVRLFDPEGLAGDSYAGLARPVRWDPVGGCDQPATAIMRAGYLLSATSRDGVSSREFWEGQAHRALRCLLMAAALDGADMHAVVRWTQNFGDGRPVAILEASARAPRGWADELRSVQDTADATRKSITATLSQAVQFMADPALAYAATPPRGESFDAAAFLADRGALYVLGTHREHAPIAPLYAAFTGHLFETAKQLAARRRGGRLDPPLTFVLDEAARVCRVPLDRWTADAGGSGIPMVISVQGPDQLYDVWGEHGGATIWTNAAIKLVFGGLQSGKHLQELSTLCGERVHRIDGHTIRVPVMRPEDIMRLPDFEALILRRNTGAVLGRIRPVWQRRRRRAAAPAPDPRAEWTGPLATVIRLADWRRRREQRDRDAS